MLKWRRVSNGQAYLCTKTDNQSWFLRLEKPALFAAPPQSVPYNFIQPEAYVPAKYIYDGAF